MKFRDIRLTKNFLLSELVKSEDAEKSGVANIPNSTQIENLKAFAIFLLQPLRDLLGKKIVVSSGFRSPEVNRLVGSKKNRSQHLANDFCAAADIYSPTMLVRDLYDFIVANKERLNYDQCILELKEGVVHLSFKRGRQTNFILKSGK